MDTPLARRDIGCGLLTAAFPALAYGMPPRVSVNAAPNTLAACRRLGFLTTGLEQVKNGIRFVPMVLAGGQP
jgi:hypothetical protein